jgi:Uncharacterised protein family (UPF0158)
MPVALSDLLEAFEFASNGGGIAEFNAYICRKTGKLYYQTDFDAGESGEEELPEDIDDTQKYLRIPNKHELDLGKQLVFDFVREHLPDDFADVRHFLSKRGGYRTFKTLMARRGAIDRWYAFEDDATERALREWCALHDIEIVG